MGPLTFSNSSVRCCGYLGNACELAFLSAYISLHPEYYRLYLSIYIIYIYCLHLQDDVLWKMLVVAIGNA